MKLTIYCANHGNTFCGSQRTSFRFVDGTTLTVPFLLTGIIRAVPNALTGIRIAYLVQKCEYT